MKQILRKTIQVFGVITLLISCQQEEQNVEQLESDSKPYLVEEELAREIALNVLKNEKNNHLDKDIDLEVTPLMDINDEPYLYIINHTGDRENSFTIIAGDKRLEPVLAYGDNEFDLQNIPDQLEYWLENYTSQIDYFRRENTSISLEEVKTFEKKAKSISSDGKLGKSGSELVRPLLSSKWGQGCTYNSLLAKQEDIGDGCNNSLPCGRAYTGCVATCLSQVVNYYKSMDGFDYSLLRYSYLDTDAGTLQGDEVGRLMKEVGEIMSMEYTCNVSLAYSSDMLRSHVREALGFDAPLKRASFRTMDLEEILSEMKAKNPVVISGKDYKDGRRAGHLWVLDGFVRYFQDHGDTLYFHFNLGWDGRSNGWYLYNDFKLGNYDFNQYVKVYYNFRS